MLQVGFNPASVTWAVEQVYRGAEEAGRNPDEIEIVLMGGMWVSDDLEEAREQSRWAAACAANHLGDVMQRVPDHGMPDELTRLVEAQPRVRLLRRPSGLVGGAHRLADRRAHRRLRHQRARRAMPGAHPGSGQRESTRSPAPTSTVRSTRCSA